MSKNIDALRQLCNKVFARKAHSLATIDFAFFSTYSQGAISLDGQSWDADNLSEEQRFMQFDAVLQRIEPYYSPGFGHKSFHSEILFKNGDRLLLDDYDGSEFWQFIQGGCTRTRLIKETQKTCKRLKIQEKIDALQQELDDYENNKELGDEDDRS